MTGSAAPAGSPNPGRRDGWDRILTVLMCGGVQLAAEHRPFLPRNGVCHWNDLFELVNSPSFTRVHVPWIMFGRWAGRSSCPIGKRARPQEVRACEDQGPRPSVTTSLRRFSTTSDLERIHAAVSEQLCETGGTPAYPDAAPARHYLELVTRMRIDPQHVRADETIIYELSSAL